MAAELSRLAARPLAQATALRRQSLDSIAAALHSDPPSFIGLRYSPRWDLDRSVAMYEGKDEADVVRRAVEDGCPFAALFAVAMDTELFPGDGGEKSARAWARRSEEMLLDVAARASLPHALRLKAVRLLAQGQGGREVDALLTRAVQAERAPLDAHLASLHVFDALSFRYRPDVCLSLSEDDPASCVVLAAEALFRGGALVHLQPSLNTIAGDIAAWLEGDGDPELPSPLPVVRVEERVLAMLQRAGSAGYAAALRLLGDVKLAVAVPPSNAVPSAYLEAARQGDLPAAVRIVAEAVRRNDLALLGDIALTDAVSLLVDGVGEGIPEATVALATCYRHGIGKDQDASVAVDMLTKVASGPSPPFFAQLALGLCLQQGIDGPQDRAQGSKLICEASGLPPPPFSWTDVPPLFGEQRAQAVFEYGNLLLTGFGQQRAKFPLLAIGCFRLAVFLGCPRALIPLGRCFADGTGVPQRPRVAVSCFRRSVDLGCVDGLVHLAQCLVSGNGIDADLDAARTALEAALAQGCTAAAEPLAALLK